MTDERDHAAAWKAAVDARPESLSLLDYDEVPDPHPPIYAQLAVERRYGDAFRAGRASRTGWRVSVRPVGDTVDECRWALKVIAAAVDGVSLTVDGESTSPVTFESAQAPGPDDGRYSAVAFYTYAL